MNPATYLLRALFARAPAPCLVELRFKVRGREGMGREFWPSTDLAAAADRALQLGSEGDTYLGVLPRHPTPPKQTGGKEAVPEGRVLWADCDTPESVRALAGFRPVPAIVVRSGSGGRHAYWPLRDVLEAGELEAANRKLAVTLGADAKATDAPRILRVPGTFNFKHDPPRPVEVTRFSVARFAVSDVTAEAREVVPVKPKARPVLRQPVLGDSALSEIPSADYFAALCGVGPGRDSKVCCPLPDHDDSTPSCHLYDDGWYCHGCQRGGTVYDLGAHLWGLGTRGEDFKALDRRLRDELGVAA